MNPALKIIIKRNLIAFGVIAGVLWVAFQLGKYVTRKRLEPILSKINFSEQYFDLKRDFEQFSVKRSFVIPGHETRTCLKGETFFEFVTVSHTTNFTISSGLEEREFNKPVNMAYRLYSDTDPSKQIFESGRTFIAGSLAPFKEFPQYASRVIAMPIKCPEQKARISIQAVQEGVAWQQDVAKPEQWVEFSIEPLTANTSLPPSTRALATSKDKINWQALEKAGADVETLKKAYDIAVQILTQTAEIVPTGDSKLISFAAGIQYPMVWTRDMATIQRAVHFIRPNETLRLDHWTSLFWNNQMKDGQVPDWVTPFGFIDGKKTDKNDVQSDQELWTIIGTFEAVEFKLRDKVWLNKFIPHAASALDWLLQNRWDSSEGCVWSGHIADWGDVGLHGKDSSDSTKLGAGKPYVCGIFHQALLFQALALFNKHAPKQLAEIPSVKKLGGTNALIKAIRRFTQNSLWDEQAGYYKIHVHTTKEPAHLNDDDAAKFALGGNLLAIESGLASPEQHKKIVATVLSKQKQFALPTVGFVLLPPYAAGTYENEIMDEAFEYQNGGDWDWFGARMAYRIFQINQKAGLTALTEIANKNNRLGSFYEWTRKDGSPGAGANLRAGAAAYVDSLHHISESLR